VVKVLVAVAKAAYHLVDIPTSCEAGRIADPKTDGTSVTVAKWTRDAPKLRAIARDPDVASSHRAGALYGLGDLRDREALELMVSLASATDSDLRNGAVGGLARLAVPEALPTLLAVAAGDEEDLVRWKAYDGLGRIGGPEALRALTRGLDERRWWGRRLVAQQLARLGGQQAAHSILEAARRERWPFRWLRLRLLAEQARRAGTANPQGLDRG
jgi:HEAT repeat protein